MDGGFSTLPFTHLLLCLFFLFFLIVMCKGEVKENCRCFLFFPFLKKETRMLVFLLLLLWVEGVFVYDFWFLFLFLFHFKMVGVVVEKSFFLYTF
ncbi:hypothetical protein BC829DRAFT_403835 [Chytridium lagenaria]|nr:hypothetical protein BC829DRAFT_403835 [Chytridium lagenaria]